MLAKSYSAHDAGRSPVRSGSGRRDPRRGAGRDAEPAGAALVTRPMIGGGRVGFGDDEDHVPARSAASGDSRARPSPTLRRRTSATARRRRSSTRIVEPLWTGVRALAAVDGDGASWSMSTAIRSAGFDDDHRGARGASVGRGGRARRLHHQADAPTPRRSSPGPTRCRRSGSLVGLRRNRALDTLNLKEEALAATTFDRRTRSASSRPTCCGSTGRRCSTSRCSSAAACSRPVVVESDGVRRRGVRPSADRDAGSGRGARRASAG